MGLPAFALVTLAELQQELGTGSETVLEAVITRASRMIESHCRRRLVYRAPVESVSSVVAPVLPAAGALTVVPLSAPRTLVVEVTDADRSLVGTLTIAGTVDGGGSVSRTFSLARGGRQHCPDFFTGTPTVTVSDLSGGNSADRVSVGTSQGYLEYHSLEEPAAAIRLLGWPLVQVLSVHESCDRTWDADSLLTVDDGYAVSREHATLTRLSGGLPSQWSQGWRTIRAINSAGYRSTAVPEDLKYACIRLCALMFRDTSQKTHGIQGTANEVGNWTRYTQADIDGGTARLLMPYRAAGRGVDTGERPTLDGEDC